MVSRLLIVAGEMTYREWVIDMAMITVSILILWRAGSNVREIRYIRRLGIKRGNYYASRVWGARLLPLIVLLMVEIVVVLVVGVLTVLKLREVTFW
ncbi:hypothetical protein CTZ24_24625 (plasmid) [Pantoea phytobeneficialis]|uniref:Uncharacterized protein n=1 Tax=Pantoea phytobeneficialis TaxID=2052056 RepID=A0AAP9HA81_9GAMM|nr:hypothetical protein CTZ24_24625 [Pantoea phytobeneficialis]